VGKVVAWLVLCMTLSASIGYLCILSDRIKLLIRIRSKYKLDRTQWRAVVDAFALFGMSGLLVTLTFDP